MFEKIYKRRFDIARHENGPLAAERKAFLQKFDEHERPSQNRLVIVACYLLLVTETLRLAERGDEKIGLKEIKEQAALWSTRKSNRFRSGPYSDSARQRFIRWSVRFLEFLGRFEPPNVPPTPYDDWLHQYETFLREERELVESTIDARCRDIRRFLHRLDVSPQDFASVTVDRIQRTLIGQLEEADWKRNTVQGFVAALRGFFRYAERKKWAPPNLPSPSTHLASINTNPSRLVPLGIRCVRPKANEDLLILVDLPDEVCPDSADWAARRALAVDWAQALDSLTDSLGFKVRLGIYRNVHGNNADLPESCCVLEPNRVPDSLGLELLDGESRQFASVFEHFKLIMAPTEFSATAPLKINARQFRFRAATMGGFTSPHDPRPEIGLWGGQPKSWVFEATARSSEQCQAYVRSWRSGVFPLGRFAIQGSTRIGRTFERAGLRWKLTFRRDLHCAL